MIEKFLARQELQQNKIINNKNEVIKNKKNVNYFSVVKYTYNNFCHVL